MGGAGSDVYVVNYGTDGGAGWSAAYNDPFNGTDTGRAIAVDAMAMV